MFLLNHYKNPKSFTKKGVTWNKINKTYKKSSPPLFFFFVIFLFITITINLTNNFVDETIFFQENSYENKNNPIKTKNFNYNLIHEEILKNENNQENSWLSSTNIFWCSIIFFICGCCAYYVYQNGFSFSFENNNNIRNDAPVKNIASAILNHVPINLIEQYKADIHYYFIEDPIIAYEIIFRIDNFLDHTNSPIGEHAIKALEKIAFNLDKSKDLFEAGDFSKGTQILNEIIFKLKEAVIKGHQH